MSESPRGAPGAGTIIYTFTDEAPALATYSLLPIIEVFAGVAGVDVETRDISLAGRILAAFPERLTDEQRVGDALGELGELALTPGANIIKLPNISASVPQMKAAISELQTLGYDLPDFPDELSTEAERDVRARYGHVMGSAVNPVLKYLSSPFLVLILLKCLLVWVHPVYVICLSKLKNHLLVLSLLMRLMP